MFKRSALVAGLALGFLGLATPTYAQSCVVADPTSTPLNVRATPGGAIVATIYNGTWVRIVRRSGAWVFIAHDGGHPIGWVYRRFLSC